MADTADVKNVKADEYYEVTLNKAVKYGSMWLRPGHRHVMKGSTAVELGDAISKATPIKG